ncbi:MAG: hypothetical protein F4Z31_01820 [Gemmatimonadetes bacterium]|nr:hypothetical protein [Gemmatimonadota bacterium]
MLPQNRHRPRFRTAAVVAAAALVAAACSSGETPTAAPAAAAAPAATQPAAGLETTTTGAPTPPVDAPEVETVPETTAAGDEPTEEAHTSAVPEIPTTSVREPVADTGAETTADADEPATTTTTVASEVVVAEPDTPNVADTSAVVCVRDAEGVLSCPEDPPADYVCFSDDGDMVCYPPDSAPGPVEVPVGQLEPCPAGEHSHDGEDCHGHAPEEDTPSGTDQEPVVSVPVYVPEPEDPPDGSETQSAAEQTPVEDSGPIECRRAAAGYGDCMDSVPVGWICVYSDDETVVTCTPEGQEEPPTIETTTTTTYAAEIVIEPLDRCTTSRGAGTLTTLVGTTAGAEHTHYSGLTCAQIKQRFDEISRAEARRVTDGSYPCEYPHLPEFPDHEPNGMMVGCWPYNFQSQESIYAAYLPMNTPLVVEAMWECYRDAMSGPPEGIDEDWWPRVSDCNQAMYIGALGSCHRTGVLDDEGVASEHRRRMVALKLDGPDSVWKRCTVS